MTERIICVMARMLDQDDGLGVYARNLLEQLLDLDRSSRYLILLRTDKCKDLFAKHPRADVRVLPARAKTVWDQVVAPLAAWRAKADLIFNPKFSVPLAWRGPQTFVLQGSDWYVNPQNYPWWDNLYIRFMLPLYCRKTERLLSISQTVVDDLEPCLKLDRAKITVSYAAPGAQFTPRRDEAALARFRADYALPERFILTVARGYHTGHGRLPEYPGGNNERLIRAYAAYRARGGRLPLVVAGRRIREYLDAHGFGERELEGVRFLGFVPHERIHLAYQLADFFVLATLNESFAFPLVEAMACGCPVIAPSTGACPEIAGGAARLVEPKDEEAIAGALSDLSASAALRATLRRAGLEQVKRYTWRETARRTLAVFDAMAPVKGGAVRAEGDAASAEDGVMSADGALSADGTMSDAARADVSALPAAGNAMPANGSAMPTMPMTGSAMSVDGGGAGPAARNAMATEGGAVPAAGRTITHADTPMLQRASR
jgi:glycosyltransferase involved in cell wall biosynthesis